MARARRDPQGDPPRAPSAPPPPPPAPLRIEVSLPQKRERNAAETRRRILDAAEAEFAAKGFDGARLGSIARTAGVQQALIHHYFADKGGLYRDVVGRALGGMSEDSLGILAEVDTGMGRPASKRKTTPAEVSAVVEAFVGLLLRFYAAHAATVALLRHEAQRGDSMALDLFVAKIKPVFDAVVARIQDMQSRGELRADLDARHTCLNTVAMVSAPFQEADLLTAIWPTDVRSPIFLEARRREIVDTIVGRILPR